MTALPSNLAPWHVAQVKKAATGAEAFTLVILAALVKPGSEATWLATASTSAGVNICFDIARMRRPSVSSACLPRRPVWNAWSCADTYQAGRPAIIGAPMAGVPSPAAPWHGTQALNSSAPVTGAASDRRAQLATAKMHASAQRAPKTRMTETVTRSRQKGWKVARSVTQGIFLIDSAEPGH